MNQQLPPEVIELAKQVSEHTTEIIVQIVSKHFKLTVNDIRDAIQKELKNPDNKAKKSPKQSPKAKTITK